MQLWPAEDILAKPKQLDELGVIINVQCIEDWMATKMVYQNQEVVIGVHYGRGHCDCARFKSDLY